MKRHVAAAATAVLMVLGAGPGAAPASAAPVTVTDIVQCQENSHDCATDSYDVRCTQHAEYLHLRVVSGVWGYLMAVGTAPSAMAGKAKRTRAFWDDPGTLVFHAPEANGSLMKVLVTLLGEAENPTAQPYTITASCYSFEETGGVGDKIAGGQNLDDDDPDEPDPGPGPHTVKVFKGTSITKKQDQ